MDFTNDVLKEIKDKKQHNIVYSKYYYRLAKEYQKLGLHNRFNTIFRKHNRIHDCMNLWDWDIYKKNKLMDLQRVNRCMDNRFCPNCRKFNLASAIHNISPSFKSLIDEGYYPYLLTLTIPNVEGIALRDTIDKLNKSFKKFYELFYRTDRHGFKDKLITFEAALKVLEITVNNNTGTYHPHFHIMLFSKEYDKSIFEKKYKGPWSNNRQAYSYYSDIDFQIMKLWKLCYDGISCSKINYDNLDNRWQDLYLCDIRELDTHGIYEVLKYTFKDTDIKNYDNFKFIFLALEGKRIRQGYGKLYNLKLEEEVDGEKLELSEFLEKKENPEKIITREINELLTVYHGYKKISRFKAHKEFENIR